MSYDGYGYAQNMPHFLSMLREPKFAGFVKAVREVYENGLDQDESPSKKTRKDEDEEEREMLGRHFLAGGEDK